MYIREHEEGVTINVRVIPGSSRNALSQDRPDCLSVKLTAPPVEGRANKELVKFLGKILRVAPSAITLLRGQASKNKVLLIRGVEVAYVHDKIMGHE